MPQWLEVSLQVICGAWGGFLIAALWYGHQELVRLRRQVEALRAGVWGGERPLSEGEVEPPPQSPPPIKPDA
jgi:hypothetical protein